MISRDDAEGTHRRQRGRPRGPVEQGDRNTIKSLDRALVILAELGRMESASLSELTQALGESPATTYRVLMTFAAHGMVENDAATQTWSIGASAFLIGSVFLRRTSLVESSRPVLRGLMEDTGETANLGIEQDGYVLFVSQVETQAPIRAFFPPGALSPLHASGIGKALLAHRSQAHIDRITPADLTVFTPFTLSTVEALRANLSLIRARGYAVDDQERNEGMRCIAAPIRNAHNEVVAGLSVSGPTSRVRTERVEAIAEQVIRAAAAVSAALGAPAAG